jgi:macrolide-specific efflux system membrane fusion protein
MYAQADLTTDQHQGVLTIPIPAADVGSDETSGQVAVVTRENRIEVRKVQLGVQTESRIEVRSGLREGDLVVTGNRSSLKSGQQVQPKLTETATPSGS